MPFVEISPAARSLMRALAGAPADRYIEQTLQQSLGRLCGQALPSLSAARTALLDPHASLSASLGHYAFLRRGRDRNELGSIARKALVDAESDGGGPLLERPDGRSVWACFQSLCEEAGRKPYAELNYGPVAGLVELAQEIYRADGVGSLAQWVGDAVVRSGRHEPELNSIVDIRGVGPKFASVFLRDVCHLLNLEDKIAPIDRPYLQPIDKWIRLVAPLVLDSRDDESLPDWVLAGKIAKYTRQTGTSGIRFNMGASWLGGRESTSTQAYEHTLRNLAGRFEVR